MSSKVHPKFDTKSKRSKRSKQSKQSRISNKSNKSNEIQHSELQHHQLDHQNLHLENQNPNPNLEHQLIESIARKSSTSRSTKSKTRSRSKTSTRRGTHMAPDTIIKSSAATTAPPSASIVTVLGVTSEIVPSTATTTVPNTFSVKTAEPKPILATGNSKIHPGPKHSDNIDRNKSTAVAFTWNASTQQHTFVDHAVPASSRNLQLNKSTTTTTSHSPAITSPSPLSTKHDFNHDKEPESKLKELHDTRVSLQPHFVEPAHLESRPKGRRRSSKLSLKSKSRSNKSIKWRRSSVKSKSLSNQKSMSNYKSKSSNQVRPQLNKTNNYNLESTKSNPTQTGSSHIKMATDNSTLISSQLKPMQNDENQSKLMSKSKRKRRKHRDSKQSRKSAKSNSNSVFQSKDKGNISTERKVKSSSNSKISSYLYGSGSGSTITGSTSTSITSTSSSSSLSLSNIEAADNDTDKKNNNFGDSKKRMSSVEVDLDSLLANIIAERSKLENEELEGTVFGPTYFENETQKKVYQPFNPCCSFNGVVTLRTWCIWLGLWHIGLGAFGLGLKLLFSVVISEGGVVDKQDHADVGLFVLIGLIGFSGIFLFISAIIGIACMTIIHAVMGSLAALISFVVGIIILRTEFHPSNVNNDDYQGEFLGFCLVFYPVFFVYVVLCSIGLFTELRAGIYFNYWGDPVPGYQSSNSESRTTGTNSQYSFSVASSSYLHSRDNI